MESGCESENPPKVTEFARRAAAIPFQHPSEPCACSAPPKESLLGGSQFIEPLRIFQVAQVLMRLFYI
jgi:hypothetical protein